MADNTNDSIEEILEFWFGSLSADSDVDRTKNKLWWAGGDDIDAEIKRKFGALVERALKEELDDWKKTARGSLALVILLDQFTRTLGRGTAQAYVGDVLALGIVNEAMAAGLDRELRCIERAFFYMPLMHAEDKAVAEQCVKVFGALSDDTKDLSVEGYPDFLSHAKQHADIVKRFGRYPHRNELLGRDSTAEEESFLSDGGPTFGQKAR